MSDLDLKAASEKLKTITESIRNSELSKNLNELRDAVSEKRNSSEFLTLKTELNNFFQEIAPAIKSWQEFENTAISELVKRDLPKR